MALVILDLAGDLVFNAGQPFCLQEEIYVKFPKKS